MGYGASFNPSKDILNYNPNNKANQFANPSVSIIPSCDVINLQKERMKNEWQSFLNLTGFTIAYKRTNYNVNKHNPVLGEDTSSPYPEEKILKGFFEIASNIQFFGNMGEENKKEIILTVSIEDYENAWGKGTYPTAGDTFYVVNSDCGDIEKITPEVYQVTEKSLGNEKNVDLLFGGYVWKVYATRNDYSFEPGSFVEHGNTIPHDNEEIGIKGQPDRNMIDLPHTNNSNKVSRKDYSNEIPNSIFGI